MQDLTRAFDFFRYSCFSIILNLIIKIRSLCFIKSTIFKLKHPAWFFLKIIREKVDRYKGWYFIGLWRRDETQGFVRKLEHIIYS